MPKLFVTGFTVLFLMCGVSGIFAAGPIPTIGDEEITLGKDAVREVEKNHKLLDDPDLLARLEKIGNVIAEVANRTETEAGYGSSVIVPFTYTFKIIDSDDVNALSIPGGHIYVHKGLIDQCESDHELAGVLAHEIAHAAHHHMVHLLRQQSRLDGRMALILVAGLLTSGDAKDMTNVMLGTQFYKTAKLNGYGQKAEQDADLTAISYLIHTEYNPVGMLTFLERLADHPDLIDWGIYQTHPRAWERVRSVKERLMELGIDIDRRAVTTSTSATVRSVDSTGVTCYEVVVGETAICRLRDETHALDAARRINALLDDGLQIHEIDVSGQAISARGVNVIDLTIDDASVNGETQAGLARRVSDGLRRVLFKQIVADLW